ncbi:hypothetical protein Q4R93_19765, partial [Morganella morganii]
IARYGALFPDVVIELTLSQRNPDMLEEGQDVLITGERQLPDSEFVAQRLGMDAIGPFLYTGLRFVLGALVLVPLLMLRSRRDGAQPFNRGQLLAGVILGVALTTGINLQQVGLLFTSV